MNLDEKLLYHQIHPAKLLTDWSSGAVSLFLLWRHNLVPALVVMFVPSVIATLVIMRFVDLERYRRSSFGAYVKRYMTRSMEMLRVAGIAVMAVGTWYHTVWLIPLGLLVILLAWLRGVIFPVS